MSEKNYFIAGATSGIGNAVARRLSEENVQLYGLARSEAPSDVPIHHFQKDVSSDFTLSDIPETLHGLVYAPGTIRLKPFRSLSDQDFREDFEVNVLGAVKLLRMLQGPLRKGRGSVVLFSTVAVTKGMPFHASISAAKGAIEGLTKSLAAEWAPNIRVNCIAPSLTDTPLAGRLLSNDERKAASAQRHPLKRIGQADDIAATAHFLLSDQSSWISGQIIGVDGGLSTLNVN